MTLTLHIVLIVLAMAALLFSAGWALICLAIYTRLADGSTFRLPLRRTLPTEEDIPESLRNWIEQESEGWAREDLVRRSLAMASEGEDWAEIEQKMHQYAKGSTSYHGF